MGVSAEVGVGVCNHLGCLNASRKRRIVRSINDHLDQPAVREKAGDATRNGDMAAEVNGDEHPSVLFEAAACCLVSRYLHHSLAAENTASCHIYSLSSPMPLSVQSGVDSTMTESPAACDLRSVMRSLSPLKCLAGRRLWSVVDLILSDKVLQMTACNRKGAMFLTDQYLRDELCLCPVQSDIPNNRNSNDSSAAIAMCQGLLMGYGNLNTRQRLHAYVAGYRAGRDNNNNNQNEIYSIDRKTVPVGDFEFVGFVDFCLINGAPVELMVNYLRARQPVGGSISYLDLTGMQFYTSRF